MTARETVELPLRLTGERVSKFRALRSSSVNNPSLQPWTLTYRRLDGTNREKTVDIDSPNGVLRVSEDGTYEITKVCLRCTLTGMPPDSCSRFLMRNAPVLLLKVIASTQWIGFRAHWQLFLRLLRRNTNLTITHISCVQSALVLMTMSNWISLVRCRVCSASSTTHHMIQARLHSRSCTISPRPEILETPNSLIVLRLTASNLALGSNCTHQMLGGCSTKSSRSAT